MHSLSYKSLTTFHNTHDHSPYVQHLLFWNCQLRITHNISEHPHTPQIIHYMYGINTKHFRLTVTPQRIWHQSQAFQIHTVAFLSKYQPFHFNNSHKLSTLALFIVIYSIRSIFTVIYLFQAIYVPMLLTPRCDTLCFRFNAFTQL